jgi:serine/threonine protein kinase
MAPEYMANGLITTKSDTFSLGVIIIELMTGRREYPQSNERPYDHFIENVR